MFYIGYIDLFTKFTDNKTRVEYLELLKEIINSIENLLTDNEHPSTENNVLKRDVDKIKKVAVKSKLIHVTGGEPTINAEFYAFLRKCIKVFNSKKI